MLSDNRLMVKRQCGSCTACCQGWLTAEVNGVELSPYNPCEHCAGQKCAIYETRPESPCRVFNCGWLVAESPLPDEMRPLDCGAIVVLTQKWQGEEIIMAVPVGDKIPEATLEWLMAYAREKPVPLVFYEYLSEDGEYKGWNRTGYGPPWFAKAVRESIQPADIFMK